MGDHFRNASWSGAVTGFRAIFGLANALLAVRLLGVEIYGHLAALLSVFLLYLALNSSFYTALVARLMSPSMLMDARARSEVLASTALLTVSSLLLLALIAVMALWIAPPFLHFVEQHGMGTAFLMMAVLVAIQILAALQAAIIEASGRLDLAMKAQLLGPFMLLGMLSTSFFLHLPLTAQDYVGMLCASALVDLGLLWRIRRLKLRLLVCQTGAYASMARLKELLRSGGMLQATSLMNLFLEPLNKLLLNHFIGPVAVTTYDLAMKVIWGIQGLFGAAMRVFLHLARQDAASVSLAHMQAISLIAVPALMLHTVGAALLSLVAHHWVSLEAPQLMLFYAIATLSNLGMIFITPLYISLISRGDLGFIFRSQTILALANTAISVVAIPFWGLVGSALGLLIATIYNVLAIYFRHFSQAGYVVSITSSMKKATAGFFVVLILFSITLYLGSQDEIGVRWLVVLLAGLFALGITEPLPRRILGMNREQ